MKNIQEYFNYLYSLERSGIKYDLKNIAALLKVLGNPHLNLKFIHIAGTNGKGAVASYIASILIEHGLKTGLFTSPHILKFNERIRINGKAIPNDYIKRFMKDNLKLIRKIKPSFFEVNTLMAFKYFADRKVDIAVIEAGLGGRLDSTNVVHPELSAITQIAIDHTQYLGNTIQKIAKEKLGIVKKGVDVIVSDTNKSLKNLFINKIEKDKLYYLDDYTKISNITRSENGTDFTLKFKIRNDSDYNSIKLHTPLSGEYQLRNAATAVLAASNCLFNSGIKCSSVKTSKGIRRVKINSHYHGRLEKIKKDAINFIFDISHNPAGIGLALQNLFSHSHHVKSPFLKHVPESLNRGGDKEGFKPDIVVFGMMADKDYKSAVREILKYSNHIIFTKPSYERALQPEILQVYSIPFKKKNQKIITSRNLHESIKEIKKNVHKNDTVLFIGSFFLVSDAVKALKLQKYFE